MVKICSKMYLFALEILQEGRKKMQLNTDANCCNITYQKDFSVCLKIAVSMVIEHQFLDVKAKLT